MACEVTETEPEPASLEDALRRYHNGPKNHSRDARHINPLTLGRFYRKAVVVAGPGMGKSTLLKRLAWTYAADGYPVARAPLKVVAARMAAHGEPFGEAFFHVALGDSPNPGTARLIAGPWVLLCDGLDECGSRQAAVAEGMLAYAAAHPDSHIVAVTRPVGFQSAPFADWRHYQLSGFDASDVTLHLARLLDQIREAAGDPIRDNHDYVQKRLSDGKAAAALAASSPLLLSLSAALLARGITLTGQAGDLYEQIIELLESEPSPRFEGMTDRALRGLVLDLLGYEMVFNPLNRVRDIEDSCATAVAAELGIPKLAASERAQAAISHWEALGVVERLHHGDGDIFTFVHKTLGEYVAARHVTKLQDASRRDAIGALATWSDGVVVLEFVAALGGAQEVCEAQLDLLNDEAGYDLALRALALGFEFQDSTDEALRRRLLETAIRLMQSSSRRVGIAASAALITVAKAIDAQLISELADPLRLSPQTWTSMGAWSLMATVAIEDIPYEELKATYAQLPAYYAEDARQTYGRGLRIFDRSMSDVIEPFALAATRRILERESEAEAARLIEGALDNPGGRRVGFQTRLTVLLSEFGRSIDLGVPKPRDWLSQLNLDGYEEATKAAYIQLFTPFAAGEASEQLNTHTPLVELGALWALCELDQRLADDVWHWTGGGDEESLHEAGRAVVKIAGLSPERLSRQASIFLTRISDPENGRFSVFDLPYVDHPPLEWSNAREGVDIMALEPLLHHGSDHAALLAARLIDGAGQPELAWGIGERALNSEGVFAPGFGSALMRNAYPERDLGPIYDRIQRSRENGLRILFQVIQQSPPPFEARMIGAISRGLNANEEIAIWAGKLALGYAKLGHADLLPALKAGYEHWVKAERPTQESGLVPSTPRPVLLEAIFELEPPILERLLELSRDSRREVSALGRDRLVAMMENDAGVIEPVFQAVMDGRLGEFGLDMFRKVPDAITPERLEKLLSWYDSPSPHRREAIVPLLTEPYLAPDEIARWADRLRADDDEHIREAGHRIARGLVGPAAPD